MNAISRWWFRPAMWWQFWLPQSGIPGGAIVAAALYFVVVIALIIHR